MTPQINFSSLVDTANGPVSLLFSYQQLVLVIHRKRTSSTDKLDTLGYEQKIRVPLRIFCEFPIGFAATINGGWSGWGMGIA